MPNEQDTLNTTERLVALGGAVKALPDGIVEGYLIKFTDGGRKDLTGEYFDTRTEQQEDEFPTETLPVLYHHGLDDTLKMRRIGRIISKKIDDVGVWVRAQLEQRDDYEKMIYELAKSGKLGWSSGAYPQSVDYDEDGHIKRWVKNDASLTPTPAMPFDTQVIPLKSLSPVPLRGLLAGEAEGATQSDSTNSNVSQLTQGFKNMDLEQLKQLIQEVLAPFMAALRGQEGAGVDPDAAMEDMEKAALDEMGKEPEEVKSLTREQVEAKVAEIAERVIAKSVQAAVEKQAAVAARVASAVNAGKSAAQTNGRAPVGGYSNPDGAQKGFNSNGSSRIDVSENLKYAHLRAEDMLLGHEIIRAGLPDALKNSMKPQDYLSEEYLRHMVGKTLKMVEKDTFRNPVDGLFVKSALKANEVDTTANTGFGPEWVGQVWSTRIWEKARVQRIYEQLIAKGMMEVEVPQGANTANISTESTDPTVYSFPQSADLDSTGRPAVNLNITPFATGTVALTPGPLGMASAYSVILEEDSVIPILPQLSYQQEQKAQETIEQVIVNGDTATGANTNINLIDGTPGTGTSRPYYLASNGILKYPLVTNTALSRSAAGTLSLDDFRRTIQLFAPQFQTRIDNLVFLLDPYVMNTALALPEIQTDDVRRTNATVTSGVITNLFGIQVYNEGFMLKANSAGKIPSGGGTLGRFALVYAPYWAFGYKRQIKVETGYDVLSQTKVLVTTMRFGIVARGADAAAVTYNVGLN